MGSRALGGYLLVAIAACYQPSAYDPCRLTCAANTMTCPGPTMCGTDSLCHFGQTTCPGSVTAIDAPGAIDAPITPDAPAIGMDAIVANDAGVASDAFVALDAPKCESHIGTLVQYCMTGSETSVSVGNVTIDVTACTSNPVITGTLMKLPMADNREVCALVGSTISVHGTLVAVQEAPTDDIPFAIIATGTLNIDGSVSVASANTTPPTGIPGTITYGAGSLVNSSACTPESTLVGGTDGVIPRGGAAGGSFSGAGGFGGSGEKAAVAGGNPSPELFAFPSPLRGGCPGGADDGLPGAPGGGALYLAAGSAITIGGAVLAGGAGGGGGSGLAGGDGGASGGMIVLDAPHVLPSSGSSTPTIAANGGGGGAGGAGSGRAGSGANGGSNASAGGGSNGTLGGGGGAGSFASTISGGPGQSDLGGGGGGSNGGGGGGGGGAGLIEQVGSAGACSFVTSPACQSVPAASSM